MSATLHRWHPSWGQRMCEAIGTHPGIPPAATWSVSVPVSDHVIAAVALCDRCADGLPDDVART